MKTNKSKASPPLISNLIFVMQPLWVSFENPETQSYFLQFNRTSQTIKKYVHIKISPQTPCHLFPHQETDMIKLKILSEHDLNFQWVLYKITNKISTFVEKIQVNLMEFYIQYVHSIIKKDINLDRTAQEIKKGQKKVEGWERNKSELQWEFSEIIAKNGQSDIQLGYRLQIWNQLDLWCESQTNKNASKLSQLPVEQSVNLDDFQRAIQHTEKQQKNPPQSPKYKRKNNPLTMLKRNSLLSQIVQCSNDGSSIVNYNQRQIQLGEISGIPEEDSESSPFIQSGDTFRRSNTLQSKLHCFPQMNSRSRRSSTPGRTFSQDGDKQERLTQPQSAIEEKGKEKGSEIKRKINMKIVIVALLCFILIGYSFYQKFNNEPNPKQSINKPTKKSEKPQKPKKSSKKQLPAQQPSTKKSKPQSKK